MPASTLAFSPVTSPSPDDVALLGRLRERNPQLTIAINTAAHTLAYKEGEEWVQFLAKTILPGQPWTEFTPCLVDGQSIPFIPNLSI